MRTPRRDDALELGRAINARHTDARQMFLLLYIDWSPAHSRAQCESGVETKTLPVNANTVREGLERF